MRAWRRVQAGLFMLGILLPSCSSSSKKSEVLYHRVELKSRMEKFLALDPMDAKGNKLSLSPEIMAQIPLGWMRVLPQKKVDPVGSALQQINEKSRDRFLEMVKTLQSPNEKIQLFKNPAFRAYIQQVTKMGGKNDLLAILVRGSSADFANGGPMEIFLGHFDVHQLDWKWVVRSEISSQKISWEEAMVVALEKGFDLAEKAENSAQSLVTN